MTGQQDIFQSEKDGIHEQVLARHYDEWGELEGFRSEALEQLARGMTESSETRVKLAKMAADALRSHAQLLDIKQRGERRAKRIPDFEQQGEAGRILGWTMNL